MSNPRLRRLRLDAERLQTRFKGWHRIQISDQAGDPPERYRITYHIRGLYATPDGQIQERHSHSAEIQLSLNYPRRAPQCKMLTPIFHPNFDTSSICIGDFWAASEGLDDLVIRIGRMIAYQEYNTKSPLNGLAARWAEQNAHLLPVDTSELAPPTITENKPDTDKLVIRFLDEQAEDPLEREDDTVTETQITAFSPRLNFGMISIKLQSEQTSIGSAEDNDIQLIHESIASHHALLSLKDNSVHLHHIGGSGSTSLNSQVINEATLSTGDRILFGDIEAFISI